MPQKKKIIFSDQTHFDLGVYVNKQNCSFWAQKIRTHILKNQRTHYSQWRLLSSHVERIFVHKSEEENIVNIGFQKDGATSHTANVLCPVFEDRVISRRADVVWPPRSCDLTPLDYYLWGVVKDKCYADKPEAIDALNDNIREAIGEIQLHTIDWLIV